jgi:hypothetical protein
VSERSQFEPVDQALLCISEARERVEAAARTMRQADAEPRLIAAVEEAERELLATHVRLMRIAYLGLASEQLRL